VTQARRALGISGENAVAAWYEAHGYEVLARNWRCRAGELDLVVRRGRTFVFCEVKASSGQPTDREGTRRAARGAAACHGHSGSMKWPWTAPGVLNVVEGAF
jgi:Holliday junction resolvase-like predicted endonuclease